MPTAVAAGRVRMCRRWSRGAAWAALLHPAVLGLAWAQEPAPGAPAGLKATPADRAVQLDWDKNSDGATFWYRVYVATQRDGEYRRVAEMQHTLFKGKAHRMTMGAIGGLANGTAYYFKVQALTHDRRGESPFSETVAVTPAAHNTIPVPYIEGTWRRIAERAPNVSPYNSANHNACDFTLWQPADGTWQCVSCIRETSYPGRTRLLHRWEADSITDSDWRPKGVFWTSGTDGKPDAFGRILGENTPYTREGRMQAPHCVRADGKYYMLHNNDGAYCFSSDDGLDFGYQPRFDGAMCFFPMGRDVMVLDNRERDGLWYAYYAANAIAPGNAPGIAARTARDLLGPWSDEEQYVPCDGFFESPFVLYRRGYYYTFQPCVLYASTDSLDFSGPLLTKLADANGESRAAVEVVQDRQGQYYVAGYGKGGISVAKLVWTAPR